MRDIKFRAWCTTSHDMIASIFKKPLTPEYFLNRDSYIVEQFTGLLDKNGKEIYESDIVKVTANPNHGIGVVCLGEYKMENFTKHDRQQDHFGFYIEYERKQLSIIHTIKTPTGYGSSTHSLEIIGNIHESPELLEATK